jgi:ribonucleoside-diphosphate reductase alpha chain
MKIKKRSGSLESFNPTKILKRLNAQSKGLDVDTSKIAIEVQQHLYDEINSYEIDLIASRMAASYTSVHPDYSILASRIYVSSLHKEIKKDYLERVGESLNSETISKIKEWSLVPELKYDYDFDYFGLLSFLNVYSIKNKDLKSIELPSETWLRVAAGMSENASEFKDFYSQLVNRKFSAASPILINGGRNTGALISCSLNSLNDDSLVGIHTTLGEIAKMSADSAGIGLWAGSLRSSKSLYKTNRGYAGGIVKFAKILNEWIRFFKQNENKRGAIAIYLDLWHMDLFEFLELRSRNGNEETTAKDIFTAVCVPDLFYKRLKNDGEWSMFCPNDTYKILGYHLSNLHGSEWERVYMELEQNKNVKRITYKAIEVAKKLGKHMIERGTPYVFNRDNANKNYNLSNLGTIKGLNLCIEFMGYHDETTSAQCDLASLNIYKFVESGKMNWTELANSVKIVCRFLNRVIDNNKWSCESAKKGGTEQRNIGIGINGLADAAALLNLEFTSPEFRTINKNIQEVLYYNAIWESTELAKTHPHLITDVIRETPLCKEGKFIFDLDTQETFYPKEKWLELRDRVLKYGVVNSLFCCNMPCSNVSIIMGCNESFEPFQDLLFTRQTVSGEYVVFNKYLVSELTKLGVWNDDIRSQIILSGSIQNINFGLPYDIETALKAKYKTIWEIKQKDLIDMAADRQIFCDQSQSMNLYWNDGDLNKIINALTYGWERGLKTGVYYTKVKPKIQADKKLAIKDITREVKKPENSEFECFGCSV